MQKPAVGFIGLGLMGDPMARNILKAGFQLGVYNRTKNKTEPLKALGATVYDSPAALADNADIIITIVTGPDDVAHVLFGDDGVVETDKKGLTVIDMSTIGPTAAKAIASQLDQHDIAFVDAPVTGSVPKAQTGELVIFIGGETATVKHVTPVLAAMGTTLNHMGGVGFGQAMKLVNNQLLASQLVVLCESLLLGETEGLERNRLIEVLSHTAGFSPFMKFKSTNLLAETYMPAAFTIQNMHKDLGLALAELEMGKELPVLQLVHALFGEAIAKGLGAQDISAISKAINR